MKKKSIEDKRITSIASWSPEIAGRLLKSDEKELLYRYLKAIEQEKEVLPTPPATIAAICQ